MIFKRIKTTVSSFQQRQRRLEKEKAKQLDAIEKMYQHLEEKDMALQQQEKKHAQFTTNSMLKFWIL